MDYQIIHLKEFRVIGITVRTTNEKSDNKDMDDIQNLWIRFRDEDIRNKIPHKESQEIVSLYTVYEKDSHGPYSVVLGYRVTSIDDVPEGMVAKTAPASKYAVFHVKGENLAKEILQAWQKIWFMDMPRSYTGDFDVYMVENTQEADIFVAIK